MNKFLFKSTTADLQKLTQSVETIQKNILYLTYQSDRSLKLLTELTTDKGLQKQVDQYFEDDSKDIPDEPKDIVLDPYDPN